MGRAAPHVSLLKWKAKVEVRWCAASVSNSLAEVVKEMDGKELQDILVLFSHSNKTDV